MQQVLVLNASYEVLTVVPLKRAVALVIAQKADILEEGEEPLRSATAEMPRPSVIKLRYFVKIPYNARVALNRKNLSLRDRGLCAYCGKKGSTIDHVHPRSRGGLHRWENVVLACAPCNQKKGSKLLSELGWDLKVQPSVPERRMHIFVGLAQVDETWSQWLEPAVA